MSNFEFRKYFLMTINQFRARDNLEMPNKIFDYISQIFKEISKYLYSYDEKAEKNGKINFIFIFIYFIFIISRIWLV